MKYTRSPKEVVFGPHSVDISNISTGKIIKKGVANHVSKEYEFSHFLPYLAPTQSQQTFKREGKKSLSSPFADNDMLSKISVQKIGNKISLILILRLYLKMIHIQIHLLFQIRSGLNGMKSSLKQLGMMMGI